MKNVHYINAGAGSGKTYTLTEKLAELIGSKKTTPSRVILTTFTDRAATEFKEKAREMLIGKGLREDAAAMDSAKIGTVHSVALSFIQKYWYRLGISADAIPMPEEDQEAYISATLFDIATEEDIRAFGEYAEAVPLNQSQSSKVDYDFWRNDVRNLVEKAETFGLESLDASLEASMDLFNDIFPVATDDPEIRLLREDVIRRVFSIAARWRERFAAYKKAKGLISFNDMERLFIRLLNDESVRKDIAESVDYVFVDEFQDSNPTQVRIFDALSEIVAKGSFWVGDPKQAIYDFRGCDTVLTSAITDDIEDRVKAGETGFGYSILSTSWRSDPYLVDLVNEAFVPVFAGQMSREKVALKPHGESVLPMDAPKAIHWCMNPPLTGTGRKSYSNAAKVETVVAAVSRMLAGEGSVKEVYDKKEKRVRPLRPSDVAVLCFLNEECKAIADGLRANGWPVCIGEERPQQKKELALVISVLNWFVGSSSLLEAEIAHLYDGLSVEDILENRASVGTQDIFERLKALRPRLQGMGVAATVDAVIDGLDLERVCSRWGEGEARKNTLETVKALAAGYEDRCLRKGVAATLGGFVGELSADSVIMPDSLHEGGVNVLTYHKSKGLEWNVVVLFSLDTDKLEQKSFMRNNFFGVNYLRLGAPTKGNPYSEFIVRYIPRILKTSSSNLPADVAQAISRHPDFDRQTEYVRGQMRRLLYVGATRARDYLVTFSGSKEDEIKGLTSVGIDTKSNDQMPEGPCRIWGASAPKSALFQMGQDAVSAASEEDGFSVLDVAGKKTDRAEKYLSPSSLEAGEGDSCRIEKTYPESGPWQRMEMKDMKSEFDTLGTCIHDIFAAYRPGDDAWNLKVAAETVAAFELQEYIPEAAQVIRSADRLYAFLEKEYGKALHIYRELPFTLPKGDQVVSGSMDLVWETAEGCVLVDYKNYPGYDNVMDAASDFYAGKYAPQLKAYAEALQAAGKKVRDSLIYYAVRGVAVRIIQ